MDHLSHAVKLMLDLSGKSVLDVAQALGKTRQAIYLRCRENSWDGRDLEDLAKITGVDLDIVLRYQKRGEYFKNDAPPHWWRESR